MKKSFSIFLILLLFQFTINSAQALRMPKVSSEKLSEMQTYYFDTPNTQEVMNATIATLQDSDFEIQEYEPELGFIRAKKTFKARYSNKKRIAGWSAVLAVATAYTVFSYGANAYSMYSPSRRIANEMKDKTIVVDANIFIENTTDKKTKVRFIAVEKILQNADGFSFVKSAPMRVIRIYKPNVYKEFFAQTEMKLNY